MPPAKRDSEAAPALRAAGTAPRLVVAGLAGDAGKTLVSLGLLLALRERGTEVRAFKKGPDYIDAAWLSWASGHPARNLDTWLAGVPAVRRAFAAHAAPDGINVVEGNRGLFDGVDAEGTHSTAALAKALGAPVVLVVDARKATRTLAAPVLGCRALDPGLEIAGVVLNRVAGTRHESVARQAIEDACGVRVVGAIPRFEGEDLPGRHLGLVTPGEHEAVGRVRELALTVATRHLDLLAIEKIARDSSKRPPSDLAADDEGCAAPSPARLPAGEPRPRIAYLRDSAFSFYYPENLEALEAEGATLEAFSSLSDRALPAGVDALYVGGGFPETHAGRLSANRSLLDAIRAAAEAGLPIYAECGGLMLLARAIRCGDDHYLMAGVIPFDVEMCRRPQGHGYATLLVDKANAFFPVGSTLKAHEFHYSRIVADGLGEEGLRRATACAVARGTGCGWGRDGIVVNNVWAAYAHLHAGATPEWARGVIRAALEFGRR